MEAGEAAGTAAIGVAAGLAIDPEASEVLETAEEAGAAAGFTGVGAEEDSVEGDSVEVLEDSGANIRLLMLRVLWLRSRQ